MPEFSAQTRDHYRISLEKVTGKMSTEVAPEVISRGYPGGLREESCREHDSDADAVAAASAIRRWGDHDRRNMGRHSGMPMLRSWKQRTPGTSRRRTLSWSGNLLTSTTRRSR